MLKVAEMAQFNVNDGRRSISRYETAHKARISKIPPPVTPNRAISALSAAQRGPWGPHRPIVRAGAAACGVELAAARALSASARVHVIHDQFLARVLGGTRPESRPAANTSARSVVELTQTVLARGFARRPEPVARCAGQDPSGRGSPTAGDHSSGCWGEITLCQTRHMDRQC